MAFQTKTSRGALVEETTEGTPIAPTLGTQFIALQDGYELTSEFEVLESAEFTASLGSAAPTLGLENPTISLSHYVRHSGVEGQAPNYSLLLEGLFGGLDINSTEYDTVAGSTAGTATAAAIINVDAGEGAQFQRGQALLIKDPNGFKVRNVKSISGDQLTLNYNLGSAPASGVNLGKAVLYYPGVAHPTFSFFDYRGNGAALQLVAGNRVLSGTFTIEAGQFINAQYEASGLSYYFNPIEITASTDTIDFDEGGGALAASVAAGWYKDPHDLAEALEVAMDAVAVADISVKYQDSTGKFVISTGGATLNLLWNTGANTAQTIGGKLGFLTAADDTGATSYTSDNALSLASPVTPSFDDADPIVAKQAEVFLGDFDDITCFCASSITVTFTNEKVDELCVCAESGKQASVLTRRAVTVEIAASLPTYEADKFHRFHKNMDIQAMINFGERSGSNWLPGKTVNMWLASAKVSAFGVGDEEGLVSVNLTLTAFVDSQGNGEFYLNFV